MSHGEVFGQAIRAAGVKEECPRCDGRDWQVLEGDYAFIKLTTDPTQSGVPGVPVAVAICKACGFVAMHAVSALDVAGLPLR